MGRANSRVQTYHAGTAVVHWMRIPMRRVAYEALNLILNMSSTGKRSMLSSLRGFVKSVQTSYATCNEVVKRGEREAEDRGHPHEEDTRREVKLLRRVDRGLNHVGGGGG